MHILEIFDIAHDDCKQIVVGTGHQETPEHGRAASHRILESGERFFALTVQSEPNDDRDPESESLLTEAGVIADDDSLVFERALPPRNGRRRQPDRLSKFDMARPTISDELLQQRAGEMIEGHEILDLKCSSAQESNGFRPCYAVIARRLLKNRRIMQETP